RSAPRPKPASRKIPIPCRKGETTMVTTPVIENLTLSVIEEIHVRAGLDATFAALLDQLGPYNEHPDGTPMPMKLEPWPGGRWYRDLGHSAGHQAPHADRIFRPALHVLSRLQQRPIPSFGSRRRHAHQIPPLRSRPHSRRAPCRRENRLGLHSRQRQKSRRSLPY